VLVAAALAVGVLVGFIAGLTGVGGGVLMVPFLYVLYGRLQVEPRTATVLAHATSLAVIVPTAIRGLIGYRGSELIRWRFALPLALSAAVAAALTAQFATRLPASALRIGFAIFLFLVAGDLLLRTGGYGEDLPEPTQTRTLVAVLLGLPVGMFSAALGIGGGIPATMGMYYFLRVPVRMIAATSLAFIIFTAAAGSASYMLQSPGPLPFTGTLGYVDVLHGLPLAVGAVATAPLGVRFNRSSSARTLRRIFGLVLFGVGVLLLVQNL
jgi:uncharacterized protein